MKTILESKTNRCVFQPIKLSKAILQRSSVAWFGTRVFLGGRAGGGRVRRRKSPEEEGKEEEVEEEEEEEEKEGDADEEETKNYGTVGLKLSFFFSQMKQPRFDARQ